MTVQEGSAVLLLSCPDQKGLLAEVSSFIYRNGGNIVDAEQHIDRPGRTFFYRVEWELRDFGIGRRELESCVQQMADRFHMQWTLQYSSVLPHVAIFVSKFDHCLLDLLYRYRIGELPAKLVAVISNHGDLETLVV